MTSEFSGRGAGMRRIVLMSMILTAFNTVLVGPAFGIPGLLPGDYNGDGIVSHGDYSVLGDTLGSSTNLAADGNFNGIVDNGDFDVYRAHYGQTASLPATLPLTVSAMPTPGGNLEWTFTFSNVNGALAGHLNISTNGPSILSAQGGPLFQDNGSDSVGVPGINASHAVEEGISWSGTTAYAALGTTLAQSPSLHNSSSTLEFLRLVTAGGQPTTLIYAGEVGYQSLDYVHGSSSSYVPEPGSWAIAASCLATLLVGPRTWRARKR